MAYFDTCPICEANLDPGESCEDCADREIKRKKKLKQIEKGLKIGNDGQFQFVFT